VVEQDGSASRITWADLDRWTERGLIRPEQARAIQSFEAARGETIADAPDPAPAPTPAARERPAGFNIITIAYYFGAFAILLAYTIFMGLMWEDVGRSGQVVIAFGTVIGLWLLGLMLRRWGYPLGGNLLIFAGTGIVPLAAYTALRLAGIWPSDDDAENYRDFYRTITATWMLLEIITIGVTLVVLWRTRFLLLNLLLAFWLWFFSMDFVEWVTGDERWSWGRTEWTVGLLIGLAMLGLGVLLQRQRGSQDASCWYYLFGHIITLGNAAALALDEGVGLGLLFLLLYLGFVVLSVWLQARVFLVFGALGCYAYASYLAFDVFEGALGFVFALAAVGLIVVGSAVAFQRYGEDWLRQRLRPVAPAP